MLKYGNATRFYGTRTTSPRAILPDTPFEFIVKLLDTDDNVTQILTDEVESVSWSLARYGGLADCIVKWRKDYENIQLVQADYRIEVFMNRQKSAQFDKVYAGFIVDNGPLFNSPDSFGLRCSGFSTQLNRVVVGTYEPYNITTTAIHDSIVNNGDGNPRSILYDIFTKYVVNQTDIQWNDFLVDKATFKPNHIEFAQKADQVISYLAQIAGDFVWGVDQNRDFYFLDPTARDLTRHYVYGKDVTQFSPLYSYEQIRNRIFIKDGRFSRTFERDTDLALSESQQTEDANVNVGTTTSYRLKQTLTTTKKSISRVKLMVGPDTLQTSNQVNALSGVGFADLLIDGNMERSSVSAWTAVGNKTALTKTTDFHLATFGTRSMQIDTLQPGSGMYQSVGLANGQYSLGYWFRMDRGDFKVQVVPVTDGVEGTAFITSERRTERTDGRYFVEDSIGFEVTDTPDSVRIYFISDITWFSKFYIDDVSLLSETSELKFTLIDNSTGKQVVPSNAPKFLISELPTSDGTTLEFDIDFHYFNKDNSATTFAILIERTGPGNDTSYFQLRKNTSGGYGNGSLFYAEEPSPPGAATAWNDTGDDLWFEVYYNQSQELYKLREDQGHHPPVYSGPLLLEWTRGTLARVDRPLMRASLALKGLRSPVESNFIESEFPDFRLRKVVFRGPGSGTPPPTQTTKDDADFKEVAVDYFVAQSFKHIHDLEITSITIRGIKNGSPTGTIWVEIQEYDSGSFPGSLVVNELSGVLTTTGTSDTKDVSAQAGAATDIGFTFTNNPIIKGNTKYWLVVKGSYAFNASHGFQVIYDDSADNYTDGKMIQSVAGTVTDVDYDLYFAIRGQDFFNEYDMHNVSYQLDDVGLSANLTIGEPLPDAARMLKQLMNRIQNNNTNFAI